VAGGQEACRMWGEGIPTPIAAESGKIFLSFQYKNAGFHAFLS